MKPLPITLGIARVEGKNGGGTNKTGSAKVAPTLQQEILKRDKNRCSCCGFVAEKYQEILHINRDLTDIRRENLATTCIFCHQCFHLEDVSAMRSGVLIWLPEIGQAHLHHIARAIYVARISQSGPLADAARKTLEIMMKRREEVRRRIGTDDPFIMATVLRDYLGSAHYAARIPKLDGVRLFPLDRRSIKESGLEFNQFPQILAYWRSKAGPFGPRPPTQWMNLYQDVLNKVKALESKSA